MGRQQSKEKRTLFMTTALRLFVNQGVTSTTTADIARESNTAAGTLFLYFPTKQDLIHELVLEIAHDQSEAVRSALNPELSVHDSFLTIWETTIRWFIAHLDSYLYIQQVRDSKIIADHIVTQTDQYLSYYYEVIRRGWNDKVIKPYPPELVGSILYQDVVAVMNLIRTQPEKTEKYMHQGFEIFWNGIRA